MLVDMNDSEDDGDGKKVHKNKTENAIISNFAILMSACLNGNE